MHKRLKPDIYSAHKPPRGLVAAASGDMLKSENQSSGAAARGFLRTIILRVGNLEIPVLIAPDEWGGVIGSHGIS